MGHVVWFYVDLYNSLLLFLFISIISICFDICITFLWITFPFSRSDSLGSFWQALILVSDIVSSPASSSTLEAAGQQDQMTDRASMIRAGEGKEAAFVEGQGAVKHNQLAPSCWLHTASVCDLFGTLLCPFWVGGFQLEFWRKNDTRAVDLQGVSRAIVTSWFSMALGRASLLAAWLVLLAAGEWFTKVFVIET